MLGRTLWFRILAWLLFRLEASDCFSGSLSGLLGLGCCPVLWWSSCVLAEVWATIRQQGTVEVMLGKVVSSGGVGSFC